MQDGQRIGILGGTFDPVHVGHVVAAVEVRHALDLDQVLMPVAARPWQKEGEVVASAPQRLEMLRAAVDGIEDVEASDIEVRRAGATYTADTVAELRSADRELYLIVGADAASGLDTWRRVEQIRPYVTLVVVSREGEKPDLPGPAWTFEQVEIPRLDVSSTDLRARLAVGHPVDGLVPAGAVRVIREQGLYTSS